MTLLVLQHLREANRRKLFARLGYPSLFEYTTKELGYCESSASRRIAAMRLIEEIPAVEDKIKTGKLALTSAARAQVFFRKEEMTRPQKEEVLTRLEQKSTREVEKTLLSLTVQPDLHFQERVKPVTRELNEVTFYANDELLDQLNHLKALLSHSHPGMSTAELIQYLAQAALKKLDPTEVRAKRMVAAQQVNSRRPTTQTKREIWKRDQGRCTWTDDKGRKCQSRHFLQIDHKTPWAKGGKTTSENLRLLCATHNQLEAVRWFGD